MIQFTQYIGDAPGTTTMQMNGLGSLGICPPGYFTPPIPSERPPSQTSTHATTYDPYGTESALQGVGCPPVNSISGLGIARIRWDLVALAFGAGFAGILGLALYKRRK